MSLSILDGRRNFWQWDSGQRLLVGDTACGEVHYCNGTGDCALVTKIETLESGLRVAAVPNILLQSSDTIVAYLYQVDEHGARTRQDYRFRVLPRNRPDNYVYTEDEVLRWERLEKRIDEIEKNGAPGPAGPQGPQGERGEDGKTPEVRILTTVEENTNGGTRYGVTIEGPKIVSENGTITHNKGTVWDGKDGKPGLSMYTFDPDKGLSEDGTLDRSFVNVPDGYYVKQNDLLLAPNGDIYLAGTEENAIGQFIRYTATFAFSIKGEHVCEGGGSAFDPTAYGLPVLYLTGNTTDMTKNNAVTLDYVYGERSGTAEVKWQGSSSLSYPKKNYTIKFDNAFESVEGWGEQKKYCLKANFIDHSHARNLVSAKLWGEIVKTRAYLPAAENLFDFTRVTGTPSTWEGATTFDENGVLTPGSSISQSGYNPFNGIIFPAGTYTVKFDVCTTNIDCFELVYFGFSIPSSNNPDWVNEKIIHLRNSYQEITEANAWASVEYTFTIDRNAGLFLQPDANPGYYRFRNIQVTNANVGANTADQEQLLNLPNGGAVDGFPCIIMLNGVFHGLYTFNIPKDGWMFGMNDSTLKQAIICADTQNEACGFKALATLTDDFDLEYVSDDNDSDWVLTSLNRLISAVMSSDGTDLDTTVAKYLDWQSAIDYFIFTVLLCGQDMCRKNYLLATYDGTKWFFSAYDMDSTYGLQWHGNGFDSTKSYPWLNDYNHRVMELIYTYKKDELLARYEEIRNTTMSEGNVYHKFTNFATAIPSPVLVEDVKRWPTIPSSSASNTAQILNWYRLRSSFIDKEVESM